MYGLSPKKYNAESSGLAAAFVCYVLILGAL